MSRPYRHSDEEFAAAWRAEGGSPSRVAKALKMNQRGVYKRRLALEEKGIRLGTTPADGHLAPARSFSALPLGPPERIVLDLAEGVVVVFSDAHYWPGEASVAHRALLSVLATLKPQIVVANGDILDGATISRHDREGWEVRPTLAQELAASQERLGEVEDASGLDAQLIWTRGNHDSRFERHLAANAPAFEGMPGATLAEHFPRWTHVVSCMLNARSAHPVMIKHRFANGLHAAYNNTLRSGVSMVTGHLHRLVVTTWGDYRGRRYGVDTGTLADPIGPQFRYTEDAPSAGGSGFAVLTFRAGRLLHPELCEVLDGEAFFRGEKVA